MKIALQEKDFLRWHISNWCTSLSRCHKQWKFQTPNLLWTRNGKSSRRLQHGIWKKSQEQEGGYSSSTKIQRQSPLCHVDGHMSPLKKCGFEPKLAEVQRQSRAPGRDIVKDDSGAHALFYFAKSWRSLQDYQIVMDKQLTKSVLYPGKIAKMLPDCSKFRNLNVLMFGYAFHDTHGKNHCEEVKILWYFLNEICTVTR